MDKIPIKHIITDIVDRMYQGVSSYDFSNPGFKEGVGHFTQLVWKNTKKIGCGIAVDDKETYFVTCFYYPSGNYNSQFAVNVFPIHDGVDEQTESDVDSDKKELEKFRNDALKRHNYYRAQHKVGNLERNVIFLFNRQRIRKRY